ncbi:MAG: glycoside hydrolase family 3 protein, partial [Ruminococcus sp.]|nr:glycoside hydrolase family 3 protein [Ruminococcus sp.]
GFIVSDWDSVGNISGETYTEQVIKSVNAGIDMLMETERFEEAKQIIIDAVGSGEISEERINDAVTRIIKVKKDAGIFDDPLCENITTEQTESGSLDYRKVAEKLVEESLVLLKNDENVLPLKEGTKVYITGPAADNGQVQCGGWTMDWNSAPTSDVPGTTTILEAFERYAEDYGIEVITEAEEASNADVVLLCVGEQSYAEWNGDTEDLELCGALGLKENTDAINEVKELDKPTVTCIVAGRQVILDPEDYEDWDSVVMCYLPGSEGKGISDVLCGSADFTGKLPSPWYGSIEQIGTEECFLERGYGLSYGEDFTPKTEPVTVLDTPTETGSDDMVDPMEGTNYTAGLFKDGVYVNEYAGIKMNVPSGFPQISKNEIAAYKEHMVEHCAEEKDKIRELATTYDNVFAGSSGSIILMFLNTELGIPDDPDYTDEKFLDDFADSFKDLNSESGIEMFFEDRAEVTLGNETYLRETIKQTLHEEVRYEYVYARKLDDNLMCVIDIFTDKPSEFYEELFS